MPHASARTRNEAAHPLSGAALFAVLTLLCAAAPPAAASQEAGSPDGTEPGSLTGMVTVGPELTARKIDFQLYSDVRRQAPERPEPGLQDELRNVVVYLEPENPPSRPPAPSTAKHVMRQANESFEPHVLPILAGSSVDFPNFDPFFHNVFSLSLAGGFDLGHYPRGQSRSVTFDKPGIVKVFCHLHSDMSAVILVLETPYFAVPDEKGAYAIAGIPPGKYTARAWHERAKPVSRTIRIEPGRAAGASFHVPIPESVSGE